MKNILLSIDSELHKKLKHKAVDEGRYMSDLIREALLKIV